MFRRLHFLSLPSVVLVALCAFASTAFASPVNVGYVIYNVTSPPGIAEFDIYNGSGVNAAGDPAFPVTNSISLSGLSLDVSFASGPDEIFGSSYFTLSPDGISFDGTPLSTTSGQPSGLFGANKATLTGTFLQTTFLLSDGTSVTVKPGFMATIADATGLQGFDFGLISATPADGGGPPPIPEPDTLLLVGTGLAGLAGLRRRWVGRMRKGWARPAAMVAALLAGGVAAQAQKPVRLSTYTTPSTGAAGSTYVSVTGTGFPSGGLTASLVNVAFSTTCGGSPAATTVGTAVKPIIGSVDVLQFQVPALLPTGSFFVSIAGTSVSGASFASSSCAEINVTHTNAALAACLPSSSLAVLSGKNVTAYVPNGYWSGGSTGIKVVPVEGSGTATTIPTTGTVNSCSSNSQTGQTVCVSNATDVYEITGSTLTNTLQSGSDGYANFSGGTCANCGVAVNALTNTAVISMGAAGNSGDGLQVLDLAHNTFALVKPSAFAVSENVSVDPNRNLILSPNEDNVYDIFKISPTGLLTEYANQVVTSGEMDSAAEDCTTGIALSTLEFTSNLYISDLTQATFTDPVAGATYGTWTAPGQVVTFPEFRGFSAGTSGISVAAGTTHLGIVAGEFGGASFGVFQLPATSGSGIPGFVDYAAAVMPNTPATAAMPYVAPFSAGYDPHTITAYTSPNNGKAYGLISDWYSGEPTFLGVVDLQALLNAPRTPGTHTVMPGYDLIANGVVRYIAGP